MWTEPEDTVRLVFEREDYKGLEVVCRRNVPMRVYFELARAEKSAGYEQVEEAMRLFGDKVLLSWNFAPDGVELPANAEGMIDGSFELARLLIRAWMQAIASVSAPLDETSTDGEPSLVESMPMVTSSASQPS